MGGDQPSYRIEAHADLILSPYETQSGIYLHELRTALAERGVCLTQSSLSRFFERHGISRNNARAMRPSRTGRM
jgi:arginine repressor